MCHCFHQSGKSSQVGVAVGVTVGLLMGIVLTVIVAVIVGKIIHSRKHRSQKGIKMQLILRPLIMPLTTNKHSGYNELRDSNETTDGSIGAQTILKTDEEVKQKPTSENKPGHNVETVQASH